MAANFVGVVTARHETKSTSLRCYQWKHNTVFNDKQHRGCRRAIMAVMNERTTGVRERIIQAAAKLLARGGREAASTRAVSAAAGVQAPTIYRQFGDMRGLLEAVAQTTLAGYMRQKTTRAHTGDPMEDLRRGWDQHVAFGLANPVVYALVYGDPAVVADSPTVRDGFENLLSLVAHVAEAGRLRVSIPHAAQLIAAAGQGVTLMLIATPPAARDPALSAAMREAVIAAISLSSVPDGSSAQPSGSGRVAARAVALRAVLTEAPDVLSPAERHLLDEWLDRLSTRGETGQPA